MPHRTLIAAAVLAAALPTFSQPMAEPKDATPRARLGPLTYPRSAMDSQGGTVKLNARAKRIVSLNSNLDEYLYQIVAPELIVGVTSSAYDEQFSSVLPHVLSHRPRVVKDLESVLKLNPDLVLTGDSMQPDWGDGLREAGIPIFQMFTTVPTLKQVAENIDIIGYLTGSDEGAARERARFERELAEVAAQCKGPRTPPRIFGLSMTGFSYGDQTLFHDVVRVVGAVNVAAQGLHTYQRMSSDNIYRWSPEWVFTWAEPGKKARELQRWMADDPALKETPAARNGRVIVSEPKDFLPVSPLITKVAHIMADATCKPL